MISTPVIFKGSGARVDKLDQISTPDGLGFCHKDYQTTSDDAILFWKGDQSSLFSANMSIVELCFQVAVDEVVWAFYEAANLIDSIPPKIGQYQYRRSCGPNFQTWGKRNKANPRGFRGGLIVEPMQASFTRHFLRLCRKGTEWLQTLLV
jgi:hypothetical protein